MCPFPEVLEENEMFIPFLHHHPPLTATCEKSKHKISVAKFKSEVSGSAAYTVEDIVNECNGSQTSCTFHCGIFFL